MSYICERCGTKVGPRIPQHKMVVERRTVVHLDDFLDNDGKHQHRQTHGTQIVKELSVCKECAATKTK